MDSVRDSQMEDLQRESGHRCGRKHDFRVPQPPLQRVELAKGSCGRRNLPTGERGITYFTPLITPRAVHITRKTACAEGTVPLVLTVLACHVRHARHAHIARADQFTLVCFACTQANSRVTAITLAALGGWKPAVSSFLDFGVSPNVGALCGAKAVTPFLVALLQGDTTMVRGHRAWSSLFGQGLLAAAAGWLLAWR